MLWRYGSLARLRLIMAGDRRCGAAVPEGLCTVAERRGRQALDLVCETGNARSAE
jgi:hypothetical protein